MLINLTAILTAYCGEIMVNCVNVNAKQLLFLAYSQLVNAAVLLCSALRSN